jgi:hypothetical protein
MGETVPLKACDLLRPTGKIVLEVNLSDEVAHHLLASVLTPLEMHPNISPPYA